MDGHFVFALNDRSRKIVLFPDEIHELCVPTLRALHNPVNFKLILAFNEWEASMKFSLAVHGGCRY